MKLPSPSSSGAAVRLPRTMKAAQGKGYGDIDEVLSVQDGVAVPNLHENDDNSDLDNNKELHGLIKMATRADRKTHMLIKTLAVALHPADIRVVSGKTRRFQGPPSFPYIPGSDCCGIVVQTNPKDDKDNYFQVGDVVAARFTNASRDALCEYARVSTTCCEKVTDTTKISPVAAACLASASPAPIVADFVLQNSSSNNKKDKQEQRVLVLGAGGGIGSHLCQLLSPKATTAVSFLCGTGSRPSQLLQEPICCDEAVDYIKEDVFACKRFQQDPFDTIVDLSCGGWPKLLEARQRGMSSIVKPASQGGRYITITADVPTFEIKALSTILFTFFIKPFWRTVWSRCSPFARNSLPTFNQVNGLDNNRRVMTNVLRLAQEGKLQAVVDGPHPFTTQGVRQAFRKLESRHATGKVVVKIADLPKTID